MLVFVMVFDFLCNAVRQLLFSGKLSKPDGRLDHPPWSYPSDENSELDEALLPTANFAANRYIRAALVNASVEEIP
jgi:hypothetical protein